MRYGILGVCVGLLSVTLAGTALGQDSKRAKPDADGVRRDPSGVKGISPFWEAIKRGDDRYVGRDYDGALEAYREALKIEPKTAHAHYRLGFVYLAKNDLNEAEATWQTAQRFVDQPHAGSSPVIDPGAMKAKILFVLADLSERKRDLDEASRRWDAYAAHAKSNPRVKTFPETAVERKRVIAEWKKLVEQYAEVKERIKKREKEAEEKLRSGK
jgi:tetratricopeptide (TPR) repeat protein